MGYVPRDTIQIYEKCYNEICDSLNPWSIAMKHYVFDVTEEELRHLYPTEHDIADFCARIEVSNFLK